MMEFNEDLDDEFEWVDSQNIHDDHDSLELDDEPDLSDKETMTTKAISNEDLMLYKFISAMSHMEYNFYVKDIDPNSLAFLSSRLSNNLKTARKISEQFDYKLTNLTHIYYFNILLKQISYISAGASYLGTDINTLLEEQDFIEKVKSSNIDGVVLLEDELATNEVSLHIKSVLIPYSIYFESTLGQSFENITLEWYLDLVVDITKTVATRWNKSININKRHMLFTTSLDTVARFVLNSLFKEVQISLQDKLEKSGIGKNTIWDSLENYDLGLRDFPDKKDTVIDKIETLVTAEINDFFLANKSIKTLTSKDRARIYLLEKLSATWLSFHDDIISKIQILQSDERIEYLKRNGNLPDFSGLFDKISIDSKKYLAELSRLKVNKEEYIKNTKKGFSTLWGTSDAYCKTSM